MTHLKALKPILAVPPPYIFPSKRDIFMVMSSQMTSFLPNLLQRFSIAATSDITLPVVLYATYGTLCLHSRTVVYGE